MNKELHLSHKKFLRINGDLKKEARVVKLSYVKDNGPGIEREKRGKHFSYRFNGKPIKNKAEIQRIKKLSIPPAWKNVWICSSATGHLQATGIDALGRKQYRYHEAWNLLRNETKFHRLYEFGKVLPALRRSLTHDIAGRELTMQKVLATVIILMEHTYIRVGNAAYEKLYGSYGLTTMKNRHVVVNGNRIVFSFRGKKGIHHNISLHNKKLSAAIKECMDIPGKELFQYYDQEGTRRCIDSGMVNEYIKAATNQDFSAKDFRTWAGSVQALKAFQVVGTYNTQQECKTKMIEVLDIVSNKLGNTRAVCKKYYIHPGILKRYEENKLLNDLEKAEAENDTELYKGLDSMERVLMNLIKQ